MLYSKKKEVAAVPKCEKEVLSDVPLEKFNVIQVPTAASETFNGEQCAEVTLQQVHREDSCQKRE